jgi:hypothetical protein
MSWYLWIKWLHIVSSSVLFGTGFGIAFFFVRAQRTRNVALIASVGHDVVLADAVFTSGGRGRREFEPAAGGVSETLSSLVCAGVAGLRRSSGYLLLNGGEAALLKY